VQLLPNGYYYSETKPEFTGRGIGDPTSKDYGEQMDAFIRIKKARKPKPDVYRAVAQPVQGMENTYAITGGESIGLYGQPSLASDISNVRYDQPSTITRYALANSQLDLAEAANTKVPFDQDKARRSYGNNKRMGYETHHITEINTGGRILNSMPSTAEQTAFVKQAEGKGFYLSDHHRNQSALFGSVKNVPGPKGAGVPDKHPGYSVHKLAHDYVRKISDYYGLPDARLQKGDNTIEARMAGLPSAEARRAMGNAMLYAGRLGVQQAQLKARKTPETQRDIGALGKTRRALTNSVNDIDSEIFYDGYMRKLGRRP